jgi:hypothetical protein
MVGVPVRDSLALFQGCVNKHTVVTGSDYRQVVEVMLDGRLQPAMAVSDWRETILIK